MNEIKWIKLTTNMFDDDKIKLIESMPEKDTILIIWIKLIIQAGKCNASGLLILNESIIYTDEMLATLFNRPVNSIRFALKTFNDFGMIEHGANNSISITNWCIDQNIEGMEKVREDTKKRVQNYRNKQKLLKEQNKLTSGNVTCNITDNVTVTESNALEVEVEVEEEEDKEKDKKILPKNQNSKNKIKSEPEKNNYAEFVSMTLIEYDKLISEHGEQAVKDMIIILDNYKGASGKRYKSDYRAILQWVVNEYYKRNGNKPSGGGGGGKQSQIDILQELYKEAAEGEF
jgi:predicted phage replisome organizer